MSKNIDVSFSYGDKDFEKILRNIVIRKLDSYKDNFIKIEKEDDIKEEEIDTEQLLGCNKE